MARAMAPDEFKARARAARTARQVVDLLRSRVLPFTGGPDLEPYRRILMTRARHFNEDLGDAASAIALWTEAYRCAGADGDRQAVIAIMMSVASKRAHASLPRERRDVQGAIAVYEAVLGLGHSADQDLRVIRTMMAVANRFTDLDLPATELDVDAAIAMWRAVHRLGPSDEDRQRVVRTMMDVANRLTDLRGGGRTRDLDAALRLWRAIHGLDIDAEARLRTVRTMMAQARRLSDVDDPEGVRDIDQAVRLWLAARDLGGRDDPEEGLHVTRTMMDVANRFTDLAGPAEHRDAGAAAAIWAALAGPGAAEEDRQRAIATMMAVAGRFADLPTGPDDARAALTLWHAAWGCVADEAQRLRVVKTAMDIAQRRDRFCDAAAAALDGGGGRAFDPGFRLPVQAGLRYYLGDFDGVIALADGEGAGVEAVAALGADALRKLHRYEAAADRCTKLIRSIGVDPGATAARRDTLVSARCCRGYCFLELGRTDAALLDRAVADFEGAMEAAAAAGLPVPPRALTGLAYVYRQQGREAEAEAALARARALDADNPKALAEAREGSVPGACPLCPPLERTPVASNALAFAVRDATPVSPGHTLVVARRHVADWWSASPEERAALLALVDAVKAALDAERRPAGYTVGFDAGAVAGQAIPHLHLHVIPRYAGEGHATGGGLRCAVPDPGEQQGDRRPSE